MKITVKKAVFDVLKKNKLLSFCLVVTVICVVVFSLLPPQVLKVLIDEHLTKRNGNGLATVAAVYFVSFAVVGIFDFLKALLLTVFGQKIVRRIRSLMADKLTRIKASYFSSNPAGAIASHFLNDVENINTLFSDGIISMVIDCFKIIGIIVSIWVFSIKLGLFVLAFLPLLYLMTMYFRKKILVSQSANLTQLGKVNNHIAESVKNMLMIKAFHKEQYMEKNYNGYLMENFATKSKVNLYDSCYSPIIQSVTAIVIAAILLLSSGGNSIFGVSVGMLAATITLITNLFAPVDNLGAELQSIQQGVSGIKSVDEFLAREENTADLVDIDIAKIKAEGETFSFTDMSFSYDSDEPVLENITLTLAPHEKVCFVGRTGVGKTTLFKLITGLIAPTSGAITLGGVDVYRIKSSQKRQIFGFVEQQFSFVNGDVFAQISLWDDSITKEQVISAMKFTGLHDYVISLKDGYETQVSDGSMFSQGQKQLLSIARAIVTNPPILLLDEVAANLDSVTEENVVSVLKKAGENKTILSIAHRTSSMLGSDKLVTIENGKIKSIAMR